MLTGHWGIDITEAYLGEAIKISGHGYSAEIQFIVPTYEERMIPKFRIGRAYTQDEMRATIGPILDTDTVREIHFTVVGAGDSFSKLCSFTRQFGFELREASTNNEVDYDHPEDSILYSLYQLEDEIAQ